MNTALRWKAWIGICFDESGLCSWVPGSLLRSAPE